MSDSYHWALDFCGKGLPAGCATAFGKAPTSEYLPGQEMSDFPQILSGEDSFQHMLSIGNWNFVDEGGGAFQLSFEMPGLHESTTWPMASLFLPWLCQFAAGDHLVCTIAREPDRRDRSLTYAIGRSALTVHANEGGAPDPSAIAFDALSAAVNEDLTNGEGTLNLDGSVYRVRAVHWSLINDDS